jgi:hypothetical protein
MSKGYTDRYLSLPAHPLHKLLQLQVTRKIYFPYSLPLGGSQSNKERSFSLERGAAGKQEKH